MAWSQSIKYNGNNTFNDRTNSANYGSALNATWFTKTWWDNGNKWAKKYTNDEANPVRLNNMVFLCCAGHSNGKTFMASGYEYPGHEPVTGGGCKFIASLYVVDDPMQTPVSATCTVVRINSTNSVSGGKIGETSKYDMNKTGFGNPEYFPSSPDGTPHPLARQPRKFTFENAPLIPPGGIMYVVVEIASWDVPNKKDSMLVILSDGGNFTSEFQQEDRNYIWRFNGEKWEKVLKAHIFTGSEWIEL